MRQGTSPARISWLAVALLAVLGCSKPRRETSTLPLAPCQLTTPGVPQVIGARCGTLDVWENRELRSGRKIPLRIAVVPATGRDVRADPLFVVVGGPGQAALETYPMLANAFARVRENRDIVLVDQRGTGQSHRLDCADPDDLDDDVATIERASRECLASLDADTRHYGSTDAADDLDEVRRALGYERIDLYGGSYGTRVGLVYAKRHREHLRALVLDGVAPPSFVIGGTAGRDSQRSFDAIAARCARVPECARISPDLGKELDEVLDRLEEPVPVTALDPISGKPKSLLFTRRKAASAIFTLSYGHETMELLPFIIHDAWATRSYDRLAAQWLLTRTMMSIASGMHFAVMCSEDVPFMHVPTEKAYLGTSVIETYTRMCAGWPRVPVDRAPIASDVPTLLVSGELDPVTPPANAEEAARTLTRSKHVVVPGQGHGNVTRSCVPRLIAEFLEHGSPDLDASCLRPYDLRFFTSVTGPLP